MISNSGSEDQDSMLMPSSGYFTNLASSLANTGFAPVHSNTPLMNNSGQKLTNPMHMNLINEQTNPTYTILNRIPSTNLDKQRFFDLNSPNSNYFNNLDLRNNHPNQMQNITSD